MAVATAAGVKDVLNVGTEHEAGNRVQAVEDLARPLGPFRRLAPYPLRSHDAVVNVRPPQRGTQYVVRGTPAKVNTTAGRATGEGVNSTSVSDGSHESVRCEQILRCPLLAQRWVPYAYLYPFGEGLAGVLMTAHALDWLSVPIALFIGGVGAVSVLYGVYIQKRGLKCACVGGGSNVPLGFVSLTENVTMFAMGVWMMIG